MLLEQLRCDGIVDLMVEMAPGVKALKEAFSCSPPYAPPLSNTHGITNFWISIPEKIEEGVETICGPGIRNNLHIQSQLREILEEAASGSRLNDLVAFSACFNKLLVSAD